MRVRCLAFLFVIVMEALGKMICTVASGSLLSSFSMGTRNDDRIDLSSSFCI